MEQVCEILCSVLSLAAGLLYQIKLKGVEGARARL